MTDSQEQTYEQMQMEIVTDVLDGRCSLDPEKVEQAEKTGGEIPADQLIRANMYMAASKELKVELPDGARKDIERVLASVSKMVGRHWTQGFYNDYLPQIVSHDGHFWRFPYTEALEVLTSEMWPNTHITKGEASKLIGEHMGSAERGEKAYEQLVSASQNIGVHFRKVLEVVEAEGKLQSDQGEPVLSYCEDGVCITPIVAALANDGYTLAEIFGDYEPSLLVDSQEEETEISENPEQYEWYLRRGEWKSEEIEGARIVNDYELIWGKDGEDYTVMPYELNEDAQRFMYLALYALVSLLGCKNMVYQIVYPMKRDRKKSQIRTKNRISPNDSASRGLFGRDKDYITADKYHGGREQAITIPTGKNTSVDLTIINRQSFDSLVETYQLSPIDGFWYETIVSINYNDGKEPITKMRGSDLLRFNGYVNPYQDSTRGTMKSAYDCVRKMAYTLRVAIDATNEHKRYENVAEVYKEQPIIDANVSVMRFDDGTEDFEIELNTTMGKEAFTALPFARYASDKEQIITMKRADMEFETVKRLRIEHRMMWRYVWRRVCEQKTSNTIVFDTIFRNIGLEGITKQKRSQMLGVLHKMLKERRNQGVITFDWTKNGNRDYSVTVQVEDSKKGLFEK